MIKFSILHATRGRPEKAVAAMKMLRDRADYPNEVEYLMGVDGDDQSRFEIDLSREATEGFCSFSFHVFHAHKGSAPVWNKLAHRCQGQWLIQQQDDIEPPEHWDSLLSVAGYQHPDRQQPAVIAVGDGYRYDGLLCTAIMNRLRFRQQGEFLHPAYLSVYSDDEHTTRAVADSRDGKCVLLDVRETITFLHRHHYHDKSVPIDQTYLRENSDEAYQVGQRLFAERNPVSLRLPHMQFTR